MNLIITNEQLTALLPNVAVTVQGEVPLINKLTPFLNAAENWVSDTFLSSAIFAEICTQQDTDTLRNATIQVVVYEAFRNALPHLDVILTPNGFGIVSNSNVAPASKERITRLLDALLDNRDAAIAQLLTILSKRPDWLDTEQAEFFRATMFPDSSLAERFPRSTEGNWEQYLSLRERLIVMEEHIATHYLSAPLMDILRAQAQSGQFSTTKHKHLCRVLQSVEIDGLKSVTPAIADNMHHSLVHLVQLVRSNPDDFPEWNSSSTAELFNPPVFENKKETKGFWF